MTSPPAYSYVRMSTNLQLKGDSLRRQSELSRAYAEKHNLRLVPDSELQDIGVSAFRGTNISEGALGEFLKKAENGIIPAGAYLLVESLDRISRQELVPSVELFLRMINLSINVVTLQDERRYSKDDVDMSSLIISITLMSRAHEESLTKSRRVGAAWKAKRDRISEQKLTNLCPAWLCLSPDRKSFTVLEDRKAVVRRIFEETEQGMGSYLVTKRLNQEGVPPFGRSKIWVQSYVTKILQSRAVIGEYQPHVLVDGKRRPEGDPVRGYFPAIIDDGLFYRAQMARQERRTGAAGRRGPSQRNLFTGIAKCGQCGSPMHLINKGEGPRGGVYLRCTQARTGGNCDQASWKYDDFEQSFLLFVREIDLDGIVNAAARATAKRAYDENLRVLTAKKQHEEKIRESLLSLLGDERQDLAFLGDRLALVQKQIDEIDDELAKLDTPDELEAPDQLSPADLLDLINSVRGEGTLEKRVKLASHLRSLIQDIRLEPEGNTPQRAKMKDFLGELDEFKSKLLAYQAEKDEELQRGEPRFTVTFMDGRIRMVQVQRNDPTSYISILTGSVEEGFGELGKPIHTDQPGDRGWFLATDIFPQEPEEYLPKDK